MKDIFFINPEYMFCVVSFF